MSKTTAAVVKEILGLIDDVFGDTSVSPEKTLEWMEEIKEYAQGKADAIKDALKRM